MHWKAGQKTPEMKTSPCRFAVVFFTPSRAIKWSEGRAPRDGQKHGYGSKPGRQGKAHKRDRKYKQSEIKARKKKQKMALESSSLVAEDLTADSTAKKLDRIMDNSHDSEDWDRSEYDDSDEVESESEAESEFEDEE